MAILNEQYLRMQKLAGIITEEQYSKKIEEVSLSGTLGKIKDKILNLPVFEKLIDTIVSKMSKEDIEKFKAKFSLNEAEGGPSLEDVFAKVNALNPDKDVKEPEDLKEELDRDSFQGKIVNLVRNLTGLNLMALGGAPLGYFIAAALGFSGVGLFAGALISLVVSLIIHGISRKLLGMSGDDGLVGEIAKNKEQLEELSTGGLDPKVLFDFVEKYGTTFAGTDTAALGSVKDKELFLDDLLTTQAGMDMLSGKLPKFAEALKQYNIKLNLTKASIESPAYVAKIYDTLIKPGIIKLDDLKNTPGIVDKMDAQSSNWSDEVINGLKDQNHINAAQMLKATAK